MTLVRETVPLALRGACLKRRKATTGRGMSEAPKGVDGCEAFRDKELAGKMGAHLLPAEDEGHLLPAGDCFSIEGIRKNLHSG